MLQVNHATKLYQKAAAFTDLSFEVAENQILGIAGPSGSGKSTLLHCLHGLEKLTQGEVKLAGTAVLMFQDFNLFPHMNVLENLTYAPKRLKLNKDYEEQSLQLLKILKIDNKAHVYPKQLSGGQKQRVALARCLMIEPDILLCDEPTSGLDVGTTEEIVILLQEVKKMGVTMVIASHDLDFLLAISDKVMVLKNGKKVVHKKVDHFKNDSFALKQCLTATD